MSRNKTATCGVDGSVDRIAPLPPLVGGRNSGLVSYGVAPGPRVRIIAVAAGLVIAIGAFVCVVDRRYSVTDRALLLVSQWQCAHHELGNQTVYSYDRYDGSSVVQGDPTGEPGCWRTVSEGLALPASLSTVFVHERSSALGPRRLVAIVIPDMSERRGTDIRLRAWVIKYGTVAAPPTVSPAPSEFARPCWGTEWIRVLAARCDPSDASHLTITFSTSQGSGTIDAWLCGDDRVRFSLRSR